MKMERDYPFAREAIPTSDSSLPSDFSQPELAAVSNNQTPTQSSLRCNPKTLLILSKTSLALYFDGQHDPWLYNPPENYD
jgi:hypothetical protein